MEDNDVVLGDDTVSRYHCRITQEDNGYVLLDQRSTNGTFINKVRIREAFVKPGSIVTGYPAAPHGIWKRTMALLPKLPELFRGHRDLEERVGKLEHEDEESRVR